MKSKKITLKQIADEANLSTAAVSMILSKKKLTRFSEDTIEKVNKIANDLGYIKNTEIKSSKSIIIICPSVYNPYYSTLVQGIEIQAAKFGIRTFIKNTYWDIEVEKDILKFAKKTQVSGIIFTMIPQLANEVLDYCKNIPLVAVGDFNNNYHFDTIDLNNYEAGKKVARHLIELGHRNIAYITTTLDSYHSARVRRKDGLIAELKDNKIKDKLVICSKNIESPTELNHPDIEYQTGYELAKQCLIKHPEITAMVGINDMIAYGIIDAILDSNLQVPQSISVCGFDNIFASKFRSLSLTSVENYIVQRGRRALNLINSRINNSEFHDEGITNITRIEYTSKLVKRDSTAIPRSY
ncbi:MAG: LacI family DNA-binding transcriptional regulator [Pleomorphochaeta sp.]